MPSTAAKPFRLTTRAGHTFEGAKFADGFVVIHHPDQPNVCTIAVSLDALTADQPEGHWLHGATHSWYR
ncbi:hypothetical protein ABZ369_39340 [Streptomyces sp. NPDC005918]|uniref:hypothetical protein n=1 Tax=Streptomyces sp. NPDC005918 TaxID=3155454 RepID=UPI003409E02B